LRLKFLKKLRTASLNSEFTGSYKKKCNGPHVGYAAKAYFDVLSVANFVGPAVFRKALINQ